MYSKITISHKMYL